MSLPYDSTPPPEETIHPLDRALDDYDEEPPTTSGAEGSSSMTMDIDPLDRPLDEYKVAVPEHVKSLIGRMSQGKLYLLEESPAVLVHNEDRMRGDPRIAALADQLDSHDPSSWLEAVTAGSETPLRPNALYVRSDLIQHLSTSKVFSWTTGLGATAMGIEWLNDNTLHLIFESPSSAVISLSLLAKAGFDPSEGDDPLLERSAHSIPLSLLPTESNESKELLDTSTSSGSAMRKRGRGAFSGGMSSDKPDDEVTTSNDILGNGNTGGVEGWNLAKGVDPNARIAIRFGLEGDKGLRIQATKSEWYKRHGRAAGKETSSSKRELPYSRKDESLSFEGRGSGEGRDFAKRLGSNRNRERERRGPYDRERNGDGGRGRGGRSVMDLDRELDDLRSGGGEGGGGGGGRRSKRGKEDLDAELDNMFASRQQDSSI